MLAELQLLLMQEKACGTKHFSNEAAIIKISSRKKSLTVFWCFQEVEEECTGKKWVNENVMLNNVFDRNLAHLL